MNTASSQPWAYTPPQSWNYAGFWIRAAALFLDQIFITLLIMAFVVVLAIVKPEQNDENHTLIGFMTMGLVIGYFIFFNGSKYQGTPGKRICNLRVIRKDGGNVSFLRSFLRFVAYIVSAAPFYLGFALAGIMREKTALHDLICGTRVVQGKVPV